MLINKDLSSNISNVPIIDVNGVRIILPLKWVPYLINVLNADQLVVHYLPSDWAKRKVENRRNKQCQFSFWKVSLFSYKGDFGVLLPSHLFHGQMWWRDPVLTIR